MILFIHNDLILSHLKAKPSSLVATSDKTENILKVKVLFLGW